MVINGIIDLDNGELLEATGKHRISALDIQGSETAELKLTFYKNGSAVTDNTVVSGAVIDFGVKADADYTGTSYLIYHDTFSASTDGLEYSGTPTWATAEVETALGNESSVKLHGQVKVVISGVTYYSQVFEVEIHNNVIQAAGTTNSVIYPRLIQSTSDPTVNDDSLDGYGVSSLWLNTSSNAVHVLMDNTAGAAVWAGFLGLTNGQLANNLVFNDNLKAVFGTSSDGLEIYHNGSNSYISDTGTGDLIIQGSDDIWFRTQGGNNYANFNSNGSVDLYYSNSKKFETTDTGATVTGKLIVSGDLDVDGTTTTFNSTVVTVDDPVFGIGGDTPPGSQDNKDRGVSFRYHDGASAKVGFYGWDNSEDSFVFLTDTNDDSTEVFSGTLADLKCGKVLLEDGTAAAPSISFSNDSDLGIYRASSDNLVFSAQGNERFRVSVFGVETSYQVKSKNGTAASPSFAFQGDSTTGIFRADSDSIGFTCNGTEAARFDSDGRFLLGQTSGSRILSVKSSQQVVAYFESTQSASRLAFGDSGTTNDLSVGLGSSANDLYFLTGGIEAARFDSDGRFAIGETTPSAYDGDADDLIVKTGGNTGISIRTSSTGKGSIFFADGISGLERYQGKIQYFHSDNSLRFATSATEAARFDSSGHFLIPDGNKIKLGDDGDLEIFYNTDSFIKSSAELKIASNVIRFLKNDLGEYTANFIGDAGVELFYDGSKTFETISGGCQITGNLGIGGTPSYPLVVKSTSATHQVVAVNRPDSDTAALFLGNNSGLNGIISANNSDLLFGKDFGNTFFEGFRLDTNGHLRIGNGTRIYLWRDNNNNYLNYNTWLASTGAEQVIQNNGTGGIHLKASGTDSDIIFSASDGTLNELMRLDGSTGNVGIGGVTAPDFALDVGGDIGINDKIYHNGDHNTYIGFTGSDTISFRTGGTDVITLDSSQRCGIGTTSPSAKLDIYAAPNTNSLFLRDSSDSEYTHNFYVDSAGNGHTIMYAEGNAAKIAFSTSGDSYFNSGNVGIGTTSPQTPMHLEFSGNNGLRIRSTSGDAYLYLSSANTTDKNNIIYFGDNDTSTIGAIQYDHNNDLMQFKTNGSNRLTLNSSGDAEILTDGKGLILSSPDGTRYKITVANDGTVTSSAA